MRHGRLVVIWTRLASREARSPTNTLTARRRAAVPRPSADAIGLASASMAVQVHTYRQQPPARSPRPPERPTPSRETKRPDFVEAEGALAESLTTKGAGPDSRSRLSAGVSWELHDRVLAGAQVEPGDRAWIPTCLDHHAERFARFSVGSLFMLLICGPFMLSVKHKGHIYLTISSLGRSKVEPTYIRIEEA